MNIAEGDTWHKDWLVRWTGWARPINQLVWGGMWFATKDGTCDVWMSSTFGNVVRNNSLLAMGDFYLTDEEKAFGVPLEPSTDAKDRALARLLQILDAQT